MQNKLSALSERIEEINGELSQENATKDMERFKKISKEHSDISPVVDIYKDYLKFDKDISDAKEMLSDPEMKNFAQAEIDNGKIELERIEKDLQTSSFCFSHHCRLLQDNYDVKDMQDLLAMTALQLALQKPTTPETESKPIDSSINEDLNRILSKINEQV